MSQKPETKFRKKVTEFLDSLPNSWFESIQQKAIRGSPDKMGCVGGNFVAIEIKSKEGDTSELQKYKLGLIMQAGAVALVVEPDNFEECKEYLLGLANLTKGAKSGKRSGHKKCGK